ncbi:C40 family peptidase [Microbacterium sp. STN6]|uniref:C40 family peptidase n=1 Tax=Microbacterium sp. STN6 TaxID=2995588 RepID=UPI002260A0C9|nr:C40 family peptidase [Microbacterium sp. STN6]MCX7523415.1 C40 family peptidase [Microbacterium sp. STN6]
MARAGTNGSDENQNNPNGTSNNASSTVVTRRSLRADAMRSAKRSHSAVAVPAASAARAGTAPRGRKKSRRGIINIVVMTFAAGLVATMALPAYAFNPNDSSDQAQAQAEASLKKAQSQGLAVSRDVAEPVVTRDAVSATSEADLAQAKAEEARKKAAVQLASYAKAYSGPSVSDFLANPPYPNFSLASVFSVAKQYIGTPYVYGGSTPAGFDCSGYVMFVYAQFGVSMPHSSTAQGNMGTRISLADAVPGDLVIMPGHDGFYAGNGNILDAPRTGGDVSIRPIWTSNYYIVRIGI